MTKEIYEANEINDGCPGHAPFVKLLHGEAPDPEKKYYLVEQGNYEGWVQQINKWLASRLAEVKEMREKTQAYYASVDKYTEEVDKYIKGIDELKARVEAWEESEDK